MNEAKLCCGRGVLTVDWIAGRALGKAFFRVAWQEEARQNDWSERREATLMRCVSCAAVKTSLEREFNGDGGGYGMEAKAGRRRRTIISVSLLPVDDVGLCATEGDEERQQQRTITLHSISTATELVLSMKMEDLLGSCDDNTTSGRCRAKAADVAVGTKCASGVRPSMAPTRHLLLCSLQGLAAMEQLTAKHLPHSTHLKAANYWESVFSGHIDAANNVFVGAKRPSA